MKRLEFNECIKNASTVKLFPQFAPIGYTFKKDLMSVYVYFTYAIMLCLMHEQIF
jgi:hypothetical protein